MKFFKAEYFQLGITLKLLLFLNPTFAGLVDPNAPRPQPESTVAIVPFGTAFVEQSSSIGTGGFLGLIGIAADLATKAAASNTDNEQKINVADHVSETDYQILFATKIADGLNKCHMRATVTNKLPSPTKSLGGEPVSGFTFKSHPNFRFLVETRLATVAVQKMFLGTKLCVYGFAKAYNTSNLSPIGTFKGSNGLSNCKNTLDHYAEDDPEKVPELKRTLEAAISIAGAQIADHLCE